MYAAIIIQTELTKQVWEVTGRVTVQCTRNNSYQNITCARGHVVMHPDCFLLEHVRRKWPGRPTEMITQQEMITGQSSLHLHTSKKALTSKLMQQTLE